MLNMRKLMVAMVGMGALAIAGCSASASVSAGKKANTAAVDSGAYVPAGEVLSVRLDDSVRSFDQGSQPFTATVQQPLVGMDGKVIVPSGAKVTGMAMAIAGNDEQVLRLRFDSIQLVNGDTEALSARVLSAGNYKIARADQRDHGYATVRPKPYADDGRATPYYGYYEGNQREIRLNAGTNVRLELTQPISLR